PQADRRIPDDLGPPGFDRVPPRRGRRYAHSGRDTRRAPAAVSPRCLLRGGGAASLRLDAPAFARAAVMPGGPRGGDDRDRRTEPVLRPDGGRGQLDTRLPDPEPGGGGRHAAEDRHTSLRARIRSREGDRLLLARLPLPVTA